MTSGVYSRFRIWQEEDVGSSIFENEKQKVAELVQKLKPGLVVQVEGKALLGHVPEEMLYYHVSEEPDIMARGYTVEAEQGFLPFPDRSIDLLLLAHSFELYHHPETVMVECERVLADNGVIFVMVLTSSWLEGSIPSEFHPLGALKIIPVSARKIKEWVDKSGLVVETEYSLAKEQSFLLGGRLSDMIIHPMGYEIRRMEIGWNGLVGVVE